MRGLLPRKRQPRHPRKTWTQSCWFPSQTRTTPSAMLILVELVEKTNEMPYSGFSDCIFGIQKVFFAEMLGKSCMWRRGIFFPLTRYRPLPSPGVCKSKFHWFEWNSKVSIMKEQFSEWMWVSHNILIFLEWSNLALDGFTRELFGIPCVFQRARSLGKSFCVVHFYT